MNKPTSDITLDTLGDICPMPIVKTAAAIKKMAIGQTLEVISDDRGIVNDLPMWCKSHGHEFISIEENDGKFRGFVRKLK